MDRGAWWATVHGVAKESDMTATSLSLSSLVLQISLNLNPWKVLLFSSFSEIIIESNQGC